MYFLVYGKMEPLTGYLHGNTTSTAVTVDRHPPPAGTSCFLYLIPDKRFLHCTLYMCDFVYQKKNDGMFLWHVSSNPYVKKKKKKKKNHIL